MSEHQLQQSEKYTIAWFKLAEFVARKERERAFGIYRLLVHSLSDAALAAQLEGDLLLAFQDEKASESYKKAITLYEAAGKHMQAAAVYEHCATLDPKNIFYLQELVRLYAQMDAPAQLARATVRAISLLMRNGDTDGARQFLESCTVAMPYRALVYESYLVERLATAPYAEAGVEELLEAVTKEYDTSGNDERLANFLMKLAAISPEAHDAAVRCLTRGKKDGNGKGVV